MNLLKHAILVVILMGAGACARDHHAAVEQICTTTKCLRGDVQYSSCRFAQECVERRGAAVEPKVDAAAVSLQILGEVTAM